MSELLAAARRELERVKADAARAKQEAVCFPSLPPFILTVPSLLSLAPPIFHLSIYFLSYL